MNSDHKKYWLGIKTNPALRNRAYYKMADIAGGPKALWEADKKYLAGIGLPDELAAQAAAFSASFDVDAAYAKLAGDGMWILTDEDREFPELLRQAPGYPRALFIKGSVERYETAVAIIGARTSTISGRAIAHELASDLSSAGVTVVSGAARGIDTAAHQGSIEAGGRTYAVLGCGLDITYPRENKNLYSDIISSGALVSEYPPGTKPFAHNFPARNRIVAGMCQGVVVVEAGERSGSLITVDFALDYGRDVFAVPGHSKSALSRGANRLIKQGAYLVESADDILEVLGIEKPDRAQFPTLTPAEKSFLELIGWEPRRFDEIMSDTKSDISSASALLLTLEISGFIKKDLGGSYIRIR